MKKKKQKTLLTIIIIILVLAGASYYGISKGYFGKKIKDDVSSAIKKVEKKASKLKIVNENSTSRPYAVMINNLGTARPLQSGLQDAYMVYEIIVEGGLTRYLALFMDADTERIGSIRSARHYFLDYALENDAIYVHHGQSPQAQSDFSALKVDRIAVSDTKTGWRDKTLNVAYEHTLFTNIEKLNSGLGKKRTERKGKLLLNYSVEPLDLSTMADAKVANNIKIKYSNSMETEYEYDETNKVYNRFVNNKIHKDYVTGKQYTFKNIITYQVKNTTLDDGENKGRQNLDNVGSGTGYYISNGYAIPITWNKKSRSDKTIYKYQDGTEIKVNDGNTFIQIQPVGKDLTIS